MRRQGGAVGEDPVRGGNRQDFDDGPPGDTTQNRGVDVRERGLTAVGRSCSSAPVPEETAPLDSLAGVTEDLALSLRRRGRPMRQLVRSVARLEPSIL